MPNEVAGIAQAAWIAATKRKGGAVTRMPNGPNKGKLAARFLVKKATKGHKAVYRYVIASPGALADDARLTAGLARDIANGSTTGRALVTTAVEVVKDEVYRIPKKQAAYVVDKTGDAVVATARGAKRVAVEVAKVPADVVGAAFGLPPWAVPVLLVGAGYLVLSAYLPSPHHDDR